MEIGQDDWKVPQGTGRRIIRQVAGHEIHLEIKDVLDKKNKIKIKGFSQPGPASSVVEHLLCKIRHFYAGGDPRLIQC